MGRSTFVLLGRRPALYKTVAMWQLPDIDLHVHDSPSEALAALSDGQGLLFLFDTTGYTRTRHVINTFLGLKGDTDMVLLGPPSLLEGIADDPHRAGHPRRARNGAYRQNWIVSPKPCSACSSNEP